jgi:ribokinase
MIEVPVGVKIDVSSIIETPGGGAANTSVGLSRLGFEAHFCGVIAEDQWGERLLASLKKEGVRTDSATIVMHETTGSSIVLLLPSGERTILHHPGANERLNDVTFDLDMVQKVDAVYLNRLTEHACMIEDDVIDAFHASPDTHLTWNPGGCQLKEGMRDKKKIALLGVTDVLLLNKEEALLFTDSKDTDRAMNALLGAGAKHVFITDGKSGAIAADKNQRYFCPAIDNVRIVDATGAGDAFGTAVTWAILTGKSLPDALKAGSINAASVLESIGAETGLLTHTQISDRLASTPLAVRVL